jgi:hypothetical protein
MRSGIFLIVALGCLLPSGSRAFAAEQRNGRFADLKAQAFDDFDKGKYAEVAGKLEGIWEEDQSDPKVAEYLAMGYLYGERDTSKASPLFDKAIALGGQATFLVIHSHERLGVLRSEIITEFCSGKMSISPGKLTFISDSGEHTMTVSPDSLKDFSVLGGAPGRIHIKTGEKSYTFRVKTQSRSEANLLGRVAELKR